MDYTIAVITNGIRKCSAKNRVSIALSTANPPHTHCTVSFHMYVCILKKLPGEEKHLLVL